MMAKRLFLFLFLLILVSSSVTALKISGRVIIEYTPDTTYNGQICIVPEGNPYVRINVKGFFAEYIKLEDNFLDLSEGPKCIPYEINFPSSVDIPGRHLSAITATEERPAGTIAVVVSLDHQIWVNVPYPGKYLETVFTAANAEEGNPVEFATNILSRGLEEIKRAEGTIFIYDWDDNLVGQVETNSIRNLLSQEAATLTATWDPGENTAGDYKAVLKLKYDEIENEVESRFKIGSMEIRLVENTKRVFKKGVMPFVITVESYWSEPIPGVRANVKMVGKDGILYTEFDTLMEEVPAWDVQDLLGYVDTTKLPLDNYTASMTVFYAKESEIYNETVEIIEEILPVLEEPGALYGVKEYLTSSKGLLAITIVLAVIGLILALKVIFSDRSRPPKQGPPSQNEPFVGNF